MKVKCPFVYHRRRTRLHTRAVRQRRGTVLALAALLATLLVSTLVFAIDVGFLVVSRTESQRTADAAALAGAWTLIEGMQNGDSSKVNASNVYQAAQQFASANPVCNRGPTLEVNDTDVKIGYLSTLSSTAPLLKETNNPYAAVRVRIQQTSKVNGQVPLFFAKIFGAAGIDEIVESTAAVALQVKGFKSVSENLPILPIAINKNLWESLRKNGGTDSYSWINDSVALRPDGVREISIYPIDSAASGNFGMINIGAGNSTNSAGRQIRDGITPNDINALGKPLELDNTGSLLLAGNPGVSSGIKDDLMAIVGQERIVPIFTLAKGNGSISTFTISRWVTVRVMASDLTGSLGQKNIVIQPSSMVMKNVIPGDSSFPWSEGLYSRAILAQ